MTDRLLLVTALASVAFLSSNRSRAEETTKPDATDFRILQRTEVDLGDRKITYNLIEPPADKPAPEQPAATEAPEPTAEETERYRLWEAKRHEFIWFSATVYDEAYTELRFYHDGKAFGLWSNVPFTHLAGVGHFETSDTCYQFWMGIGVESGEAIGNWNRYVAEHGLDPRYLKAVPPTFTDPDPGYATYAFTSIPPEGVSPDVIRQLDDLHAYYQANRDFLAAQYEARKAENAARLQYLRDHPPQPKDSVINFWPKKSVRVSRR